MKARATTLVFGLLIITACSNEEVQLDRLTRLVEQRVASQDATPIVLAEVTDFPWDRVFIFPPYTPYEEVQETLGIRWGGVFKTGIKSRDDAVLMVFVRGGQVAVFAMHPIGRGDLSEIKTRKGLSAEEAVFIARKVDRGGPWTVLELDGNHLPDSLW